MMDKRYELKFIFDNIQTLNFLNFLKKKSHIKKKYNNRAVNSIYFDNLQMKSAIENLSGISDRRKFRARWYNFNLDEKKIQNVIFEIKSRSGRISSKENFNFIDNISSNALQYKTFYNTYKKLIIKKYFKNVDFDLFPKLLVRYNREYYQSFNNIRVTIDNKIEFYDASCLFSKVYSGNRYQYSKNIVEIKFPLNQKKNIVEFLRLSSLNPTRHSKYLIGLSYINRVLYI